MSMRNCIGFRWAGLAASLGVGLWLSGCAVGPDYKRAAMPLPEHFSQGATHTSSNAVTAVLTKWWTHFEDPQLNDLVQRATQANEDLKAAAARLQQGRALRGAAWSDLFPTVDASAAYTIARRSENALAFPVRLIDTKTYQAGFDAAWELDFVGGKRRGLESATAQLQALEEARRSTWVSVMAEVARNYIELRGAQDRLKIARDNIRVQQDTLEITQQRYRVGLANELDISQASSLLTATKSQLPSLEVLERQRIYQLSLLLGQAPAALQAELLSPKALPRVSPEIPVGLPSDLLLRRPDVRQTERLLASATAQMGVAKAEFFPKFSLTGSAGLQSLHTANLFSPASEFWSAGPTVQWRILEYPRLRAMLKAQSAKQEELLAQFHQSVLVALSDVENALIQYGKEKEKLDLLEQQATANRQSFQLASQLYQGGVGEFLNVLDAERTLYQTEDALILSRQSVNVNLVALYKALGGGWETEKEGTP